MKVACPCEDVSPEDGAPFDVEQIARDAVEHYAGSKHGALGAAYLDLLNAVRYSGPYLRIRSAMPQAALDAFRKAWTGGAAFIDQRMTPGGFVPVGFSTSRGRLLDGAGEVLLEFDPAEVFGPGNYPALVRWRDREFAQVAIVSTWLDFVEGMPVRGTSEFTFTAEDLS